MRKQTFCILYENKDADQFRGNLEAGQRLCFRYIDSTIPLLSISEAIFCSCTDWLVWDQVGNQNVGFLMTRLLICFQDEPDETDSCDVDNSVFNEDDDEEVSLANSGSDLDLSQSKADFGDKIRIQATKEELTDAFKQKLYILQSEKKWFRKGCELKRTIGDTIKVLRDVYKGFSSTHGDLPKASLNEFRIELGNILSDTKLVRKLCNVVCKMYPRGYRIDNDYLYVDFENAFDFLIGLSDASSVVAQEVASQEVFLDNLFQMMEYTRGQMLNETLCVSIGLSKCHNANTSV